jgi:hypothetical protein
MDIETLDQIYLDRDFKDRTVLKIITQNRYDQLMKHDKVDILIEKIWDGKKSYECDGKIQDYSLLSHVANTKIKKLPG